MNDNKESRRIIVDRFLKTLEGPSASSEQLRASREQTRRLVEAEWDKRAEEPASRIHAAKPGRRLWIAIPAVAVAAMLVAFLFLRISPNKVETVRNGPESDGVISLADGSRIEQEPGTILRVDRGSDGFRIELTRGAILVTAAPQRRGHLVVKTKECEVSVIGTVFAVRAESAGSRVSVFEGKVQVTQAGETRLLLPGQQFTTSPAMPAVPLAKEIEWSRSASASVALLPTAIESSPTVARSPEPQDLSPLGRAPSIEGRVFIRGTNQPLSAVDLELSRVEGADAAPLAAGVAEAFAAVLTHNGVGFPNTNGSTPPAILAPEVKYAKTSDDGRFRFDDLKEGKYRLAAVRNGGEYYPAEYGQRDLQQRGLYFPVAAGETLRDLRIEMTPTGAITGRVVDEDGQAMGHVTVLALVAQYRAGEQRFFIERQAVTDHNGAYRLYWLGPGKYYVAAVYEDPRRRQNVMAPTAPPGRTVVRSRATSPVVVKQVLPDGSVVEEAYGMVYFGGTVDPVAAVAVEVRPGETYAGADIPMGAGRMRTGHIRGTVIDGETGQPARGATVLATSRQWRPNGLVLFGSTNAEGVFDLAGASPDNYILTAITSTEVPANPGGTTTSSGTATPSRRAQVGYVSLDTDAREATTVRVLTTSGITVPGRVSIEGGSSAEDSAALAKMSVTLTREPDLLGMADPFMPLPPSAPGQASLRNGQVTPGGDFRMFMAPGDFRMSVANIPASTYVKSIRLGNDDVLRSGLHVTRAFESAIQIVIGTDGGTISGSVMDGSMRPFTNATVALVPDALDLRGHPEFYRNTTSDSSGKFQLKAIPPGSYKLFAWEWAPPDAWQYADFIRNYEGQGKTIRVSPFEKQQQVQLNVIPKGR